MYRQHNSPEDFQNYLDSCLEKYSSSSKPIYILGDFNINLLNFETCRYANDFLLSLQSYALTPVIDKPTRVHSSSATLIDNILASQVDDLDSVLSGNVVSDISDHFSQFCLLPAYKLQFSLTAICREYRDFSSFSDDSFLNDLEQIDWDSIGHSNRDINKSFSTFFHKTLRVLNKHAPTKITSRRKAKQQLKPWITKGIRRSISLKNQFYHSGENQKYKLYRNKISTLTRLSKKLYFHNFFSRNLHNTKKTWKGINDLIGRRKKPKQTITSIRAPNNKRVISDAQDISNVLNKHFATVGHKLASGTPHSKLNFRTYLQGLSPANSNSFFFDPIIPAEVNNEIVSLSYNKAHGLYSFPVRILKCASHILSSPLARIMNLSVETGTFPNKLKYAKVIPVYKTGDKLECGNYRPISLLSNINKVFEKLMFNRIKKFIANHNILSTSQYGFREYHSTEHALLDIINKIQTNMDNKLFSCGIFIDLQKAFDTVDHGILLHKLNHYGVRGIVNDWFQSYLSCRSQSTQIGSVVSEKENVLCGVPQGSILGPLLFLLYVNDIQASSSKLDFFLFADDTNLLFADKCLKTLELIINKELENVCDWLLANKLTLNTKKSNYVLFHPRQRATANRLHIKVFDCEHNVFEHLEQKDCVKYLGVLIDSNLSWQYHINYISLKISKTIGIISRLRYVLPTSILLHIYRSLIHPYVSYGLSVWGQTSKSNLEKILILQKRALRLIYFRNNREHAIPLFVCSNILPVDMLYFKSIASLMHDINNQSAPLNLINLFDRVDSVDSYRTRSASTGKFHIKCSKLTQLSHSFSRLGCKIWNELPESFRAKTKASFKKCLQTRLLKLLDQEDIYVDVNTLIKNFKYQWYD